LIAGERCRGLTQRGDAAREYQRRRAPVHWLLVVPRDPGVPGNIAAIREVGRDARIHAAELITHGYERTGAEGPPIVDARVDSAHASGVEESENIGSVGACALPGDIAGKEILAALLVDARLQIVLVESADDGD